MAKKRKEVQRGGRKPKGEIPPELVEKLRSIKFYRNKAKMSQTGLAKSAGISPRQMILIEKGESMPQLNELFLIEKAINARSPEALKILPLPEVSAVLLQLSEVIRSDPERGRHLMFDIENHYKAAIEAAKKEKPGLSKTGTS